MRKITFKCASGHVYISKEVITCDFFANLTGCKTNDKCKICKAQIVSQFVEENGNIWGSVLA